MSNNENNRKPIPRVHWYDGINPKNSDFQTEQDGELQHVSYVVNDFHGSGVLQKNPVTLPPILSTYKPSPDNISYSVLGAGQYDGKGIFVDRQPVDTSFGDQLSVSLEDVIIPLYNPVKIIIFGKVYDPNTPQGKPVLETLVFNKPGVKTTFNYFKSVIVVFFNNFSGGTGRTSLAASAQTSRNNSAPDAVGKVVIREVGPLEVLEHGVVISQTDAPNFEVRDFITSTITRTFTDELTFVVTTAQNTNYVPVSLNDLNELPLNTTGISTRPYLDSTTNGLVYGQKIYLATDNVQQLSFALSLDDDTSGWSGELVVGIRPLQTKSINQFTSKIDLDPDVNILFEASFTQNDLLDNGYVLTTTPQEVKFNFIGTALAQPGGILVKDQYYVVTLTRRADTTVGKIYIEAGPKVLDNSKFTSFNPTTKTWTDDAQTDLWFKVYSAAIRVSSGIAYTNDGTMVSLQKTVVAEDGSVVSAVAGPYPLAVIDSIASDNIVLLQATQDFTTAGEHPRTGNLVFLRIIDKATITVLNTADFSKLVAATNNVNKGNFPIVLATVKDFNNKTNPQFTGTITLPGQVRTDEIVLFNTNLDDDLLEINNIIIPNNATTGIRYRIVHAETISQYLGDFDNNKIFTSSDLVQQAVVQDTFSAQSTNVATATSFDPYSIFDTRSRDALGFGKETIENFMLADVEGSLVINSTDVERLQYLTTTLPALVSPTPTTIEIQVLKLENISPSNQRPLVLQVTDLDGYAEAISANQVAFTALNVGDMRAMSLGDVVDLSADGYTDDNGRFSNPAHSGLTIEKFVQRNDLVLETRFQSDVLPTVDANYTLSFYNQNPVFDGKLGISGEVATEVLEFVAPGIDLLANDIGNGDKVKITNDTLGDSRNGVYTISQVINATTFRVFSPVVALTSGVANGYVEFFASDGETEKLSDTAVVKFTVNAINLTTSSIQEGDVLHITLSSNVALNGTYTVARVLSATEFTVEPPLSALTAQTFDGTFEFRAAGDIIVKIAATAITGVILEDGPTPIFVTDLETLAPVFLPNGIDTEFNFSLTHVPVTGEVNVYWTTEGVTKTMKFSASPVEITGDGNPSNSAINRITGAISLDTFLPPDANTNITVDYRIAPIVTLKHCYPTVVNPVSPTQTDVEFRIPFINPVPEVDISGVALCPYVIIQTNNADPPALILDGSDNVVAGAVTPNTIDPTASDGYKLPSRNIVLQLINSAGNSPGLTAGDYFMQIYSGSRVNVPAIQKEFLSDTLNLTSPIVWSIRKHNFEWIPSNMRIHDFRRFLPATFVSKVENDDADYASKNEMWVPSDLYVGHGEILSSPGVPYHGDIEVTKISLDLPVTALLSNNINVYNNLIASWGETPGFTRAGRLALKFSDGTYVGADDSGTDTAISRNQVRVVATLGSLYLDGYQVPNAPVYTDLDEILTKLHYEVRMGMWYDDANGILYFHAENIKAIFNDEPIVQTGVVKVILDIALKKSGFANPVDSINTTDILRLFTNPVDIIPTPKYSISGEIVAGFTVGKSTSNT